MIRIRKGDDMIINPYYDELKEKVLRANGYRRDIEEFETYQRNNNFRENRFEYVARFAWAIPTEEIIRQIAKFSNNKIVEIGAGTGYWAWLFEQTGVTIHAYQKYLQNNHCAHKIAYTKLLKGSPNILRKYNSNWALFLCWPPYSSPMAARCLRRFAGNKLVYIGEGDYGCTGDNVFHEMLDKQWKHIESIDIPQWSGLHDYVQLYERK